MHPFLKSNRSVVVFGALAFGAPLAVYLATLAPSITFEDSGQIISAAATLGICHPSGYPAASLVGQLFTLVPAGNPAWRVNLASAVAAAGGALVLFLLLQRLLPGRAAAAAAAAVALACGRTYWSQAVVAEVYALNALATLAVIYAAWNWYDRDDVRWGYAAAFLAGLALGAHTSSSIVTLPVIGYFAARRRRWPGVKTVCLSLGLAALGFMTYLYLPLRAVQGPAINWGDPRTLGRAVYHITRRAYGGPVLARLEFLPRHLWELARSCYKEFTPLGVAVGVLGLVAALAGRKKPWGFFAVMGAVTGPVATVALVLLLQGHQLPEIDVWYIPFFAVTALFIAYGLGFLAGHGRRAVRAVGWVTLAATPVLPLAWNYYWNDYRDYYYAEDYGANFLRTIGLEGINIMYERGSLGTFETAYLKKVEGLRPDHVFVDATGNVYGNYERFALGRYGRGGGPAQLWERGFEQGLIETYAPRGVYYSVFRNEVEEYGYDLMPAGMLYRVYLRPVPARGFSPVWRRYRMRGIEEVVAAPRQPRYVREVWVRTAACTYYFMRARESFLVGEPARARAVLGRAAPMAADISESLAELGNIYFVNGYPRDALVYYRAAVTSFPRQGKGDEGFRYRYAQMLTNEAVAYLYLGDVDGAERMYKASLAAYPNQPDLKIAVRRENLERAARELYGSAAPPPSLR